GGDRRGGQLAVPAHDGLVDRLRSRHGRGPSRPGGLGLAPVGAPMSTTHPRHRLDDLLAAPVRLSIVAMLAGVDRAEFSLVRDTVEVSDSVLSKQASTLENAGYLKVTKG